MDGEMNLARMIRGGLFTALGAAMALSAWSLFWVGRHWGLPSSVAWLTSAGFDGAALAASGYAMQYADTKLSGWLPRITVFTIALLSAFLNAQHAKLSGMPEQAIALYAAPPVIVITLFEIHMRLKLHTIRLASGVKPRKTTRTPGAGGRKKAGKTGTGEVRTDELRAWADRKGYELGSRGPVPEDIAQEYRAEVAAGVG
jgi:hypothetical protein